MSKALYPKNAIAIIGMSCRLPSANSTDEYWHLIQTGKEGVTNFSDDVLLRAGVSAELLKNKNYVKVRGILDDIEYFDANFF